MNGFGTIISAGGILAGALLCATAAAAQTSPFAPGWQLNGDASGLRFQSIKNGSKVESSSFATLSGGIDADGTAGISILLDSVDTKVDLRNVRMRFLFFETFEHPEARISMKLDPADFTDLAQVRRKVMTMPYTLDLHGVSQELEAELAVTLISDDIVSVSTSEPIMLQVSDFNLEGGIKKLEEAANVTIVPSTTVTFDFLFSKSGDAPAATVAAAQPEVLTPASAALETRGDFSLEACKGRFEILSRTDNILFRTGSARLDDKSRPILDSIYDIVRRCPELTIEVSGHTDSDGGAVTNQRLSEARAQSVSNYLTGLGVSQDRILSVGYGETRPAVPNTSADNKRRNRRIEFAVLDG